MPQGPPSAASHPPPAPAPPPGPPPPLRPRTGIAWAAILLVVVAVLASHAAAKPDGESSREFGNALARQQAMFQYGSRELIREFAPDISTKDQDRAFGEILAAGGGGPVGRRQRFAVLAGDLQGRAEALKALDEIERLLRKQGLEMTTAERQVQDILRDRYATDRGPEVLDDARRARLVRELDWFGELALAPEGSPGREAFLAPARQRVKEVVLVLLGILLLGGAGLVAGAVHLLMAGNDGVKFRLARSGTPGGIYAETFAVWIVLYLLLSLGLSFVGAHLPPGFPSILPSVAGMVLSMGALAWPVLRGVPFGRVRDDLGLRLSDTPIRDALAGVLCWVMALPAMAGAALVTCGLLLVETSLRAAPGPFDPVAPPHPLGAEILEGRNWIFALFAAAVVAPVVEETFFRGALYRHLRESAGWAGRLEPALLAGAVSSLIFAVIHPQGLSVVPVLMAVAGPMCWAREWRGSLVAPMAAHSMHNAIITLFGVMQFRA